MCEAPSDPGEGGGTFRSRDGGVQLQIQGRGEERHSSTGPVGREDRLLEGLGFFSKKPVCTWKPNQHATVLWGAPEGQGEPVLIWMALQFFNFWFCFPVAISYTWA